MTIYMDVFPLERTIFVVARGDIPVEEILECIEKLKAPQIRGYAKIVDVTGATSNLSRKQVESIAIPLRGPPDAPLRGPLAFVVDPKRKEFADFFSDATRGDRPIRLFVSLHEARRWLADNMVEGPGQLVGEGTRRREPR